VDDPVDRLETYNRETCLLQPMIYDYEGDTVVVTGAGSVIGRATASRFGEHVTENPEDPDILLRL